MAASKKSRVFGCLVGLAVGDALGTAVEFQPPGSFPPVTTMRGGGRYNLSPGQWTDDTSMMLCLAESLIECNGFNAIDQLTRYKRWYEDGHLSSTGECFDIGKTVRTALNKFVSSGETDGYPGSTSERAAGNGCLMRLGPVPLAYSDNPDNAVTYSGESARTTHGPPAAIDTCKYFGGLLIGCLQGKSKEELLSDKYSPVPGYWTKNGMAPELAEIVSGSYKKKTDQSPPKGSGYIIDTLESVLWAFYKTDNFKDGCLKAVNLGDDADTVAAIYGQLAGAYYGVENIPAEWKEKISFLELIELFSEEIHNLHPVAEATGPVPVDTLSERYRRVKIDFYDLLEKRSHDTLYRFSQPCPRQYTELSQFDDEVDRIKSEVAAIVSTSKDNAKLLKGFEELWDIYRKRLESRLSRRKL